MRKSRGRWVVNLAGSRSVRWTLVAVAVMGAGLWVPWSLTVTQAIAQDRGSPRDLTASGPGNRSTIDTEDGTDSGVDGSSGTRRTDSSESFLSSIFHASAPIVVVTVVIAVMSFYLIALVVWMALHYRTPAAIPHDLMRDVQSLLDQNKFNEAYHRLTEDSSFLARVLASGVRKLPVGVIQAQRAMEMANEDVTMEMEHRTTYLATVGTLGPMIGLVGTVYGMIMAFQVIALEGSSPQASQLAAGISTALYATLEGIAISIPAIFFYAMYRNRIARLSLEVGMTAEPLLERFAPGVRPVPPSPTINHGSAPAPSAHPHPLALSATLAAAGTNATRPALAASSHKDNT
jgi:biopolymer transport protein ExbB